MDTDRMFFYMSPAWHPYLKAHRENFAAMYHPQLARWRWTQRIQEKVNLHGAGRGILEMFYMFH